MLHINVASGEACTSVVDFSLSGFIPFEFERRYKSHLNQNGLLGWNWNHPLNTHIVLNGKDFVYQDQWGSEVTLVYSKSDEFGLVWSSDDSQLNLFHEQDSLILHTSDWRKIHFPLTKPLASGIIKPTQIEDINGNAITFKYNKRGFLEMIKDTLGRRLLVFYNKREKISEFRLILNSPKSHISLVRYFYDKDDNLVTIHDSSGSQCHFEYDDHLIVRYINKLGGSYYALYDDQRRCINVYGDGGVKKRKITYDDKRRMTSVTNAIGNTTIYKWNDAGLVTDEINPLGGVKSNLYDANNALLASINESGRTAITTTYDLDNQILAVTDAVGAVTMFKDNDKGQIESKTDAVGSTWKWDYDSFGNVIRVVHPSSAETNFEYDVRGFLSKIMDSRGHVIQQSMSQDGKKLKIQDEFGMIMEYQYDDIGNLTAVTDGKGAHHIMLLDSSGKIYEKKWPDGSSLLYEYNAEGNLTKLIDELGNKVHLEYDQFGKCVRYIGPLGEVVRYEYDLEENPTVIVNESGEKHFYVYDSLGRVTKQIFFDGSKEQYKYDETGNIVQIIDGEGQITKITYDDVRNIIEKLYPDGTREDFSYDGLRRLSELHNDSISLHLEWDNDGNLVQETQGDRTLEYTYDSAGNPVKLEDSEGRTIKYDYDLRGRLVAVNDTATGAHQFGYDLSDLLTRHEFPNSAVLFNGYDQRNRLVRQQLIIESDTELVKTYTFDPADRLIESGDSFSSARHFTYDALDRLVAVQTDKKLLEKYSYDLSGNVTYSPDGGHLSYIQGNLLVSTSQGKREYDHCGSVTRVQNADGETEYEYDGAGRLVKVLSTNGSVTEFTYDAFGRRITKKTNGEITRYVWNGYTLLEEVRSENKIQYLFDNNRMLPLSQTTNKKTDYFVSDRRGCVFAAMDQQAKLTGLFDYTAFGNLQTSSENDRPHQPFRLRGQYYDEETGLHYNLYRYYEPTTGRFLTRDPLGIDAGRNLYRNGPNPITWEDPFGLSPSECQGDVFYRAMSDEEKEKVMEDCQLHAFEEPKCPEGPYVTQNQAYCKSAMNKKPAMYKNLAEICTKPGTVDMMKSSPLACRNGSQAGHFLNLPDVVSGNPNRIEHKLEGKKKWGKKVALNYGLSKGDGLKLFNKQIESIKVTGTNETCTA